MKKIPCIVLSVVSLFIFTESSFPAESEKVKGDILRLNNDVDSEFVSPYLYFYEDKTTKLGIQEIISEDNQNKFIKNNNTYPALGFTKSAIWGKFSIDNQNTADAIWFLTFHFPHLEELTVYSLTKNGSLSTVDAGKNVPFRSRPVIHRKPVVPLSDLSDGVSTIYFRVASNDGLELPVEISNSESFARTNYLDMFFGGIYYGVILIMFIYNLFVYLSLRDTSYLYYILYIGIYLTAQAFLDGYDQELFPNADYTIARDMRVVFASMGSVFSILFTIQFLNLKEQHPKLRKLLHYFLIVVCIPPVFMLFTGFYYAVQISLVLMILSAILMISIGVKTAKTSEYARYYLAAWIFFLVGVIIFGAKAANIFIPYLTSYAMQIGSAMEVSLLSFGLAHKIRVLQKEKELVSETFGKVVDPAIRDFLLKGNLDIGGQETNATMLFTDIRKFTELSEKLQPKDVVRQLNQYLETMSDDVAKRHGLVNKYIGDAILALYNVPLEHDDHCDNAIHTAISMRNSLKVLNQSFEREGLLQLSSGIGIHTGQVLSGNIGSSVRMEYTVIGDNVNVASRIEGLTKFYGSPILVSNEVISSVKNRNGLYYREIDRVALKGKQEAVLLYEIMNSDPDEILEKKVKYDNDFQSARQHFGAGEFSEALSVFNDINKNFPEDEIVKIMIKRCEKFIKKPPAENWNGTVKIEFK